MIYLLDTNVWISLMRGTSSVLASELVASGGRWPKY
jgi:predicted nucleic acid-binding protein